MSDKPIYFEGLSGLTKKLQKINSNWKKEVQQVVKKNGTQLATRTQENMVNTYTKKNPHTGKQYSTGKTRRNTRATFSDDGLTTIVAPGTDYFPYVEQKKKKMAAEPTLRPAFEKQSEIFKQDMKKLTK